jgi:hypothetical protein
VTFDGETRSPGERALTEPRAPWASAAPVSPAARESYLLDAPITWFLASTEAKRTADVGVRRPSPASNREAFAEGRDSVSRTSGSPTLSLRAREMNDQKGLGGGPFAEGLALWSPAA